MRDLIRKVSPIRWTPPDPGQRVNYSKAIEKVPAPHLVDALGTSLAPGQVGLIPTECLPEIEGSYEKATWPEKEEVLHRPRRDIVFKVQSWPKARAKKPALKSTKTGYPVAKPVVE